MIGLVQAQNVANHGREIPGLGFRKRSTHGDVVFDSESVQKVQAVDDAVLQHIGQNLVHGYPRSSAGFRGRLRYCVVCGVAFRTQPEALP
ncbi:hypothetical protein [Kibdelosporangium aridum]|uniref:hypothetical protein n=1 Tax=Kibdelosporangium aridum TaxID=2030 RepID=UPI000526EEC7|nr:hypothetical protein [Kibdelosporangium aridum]